MTDLPAHLRDHRYAVVRLLGEGGQAATFEAVDKKEGSLVAIKRFRVRGAKSWKDVELAEREARVLASVSHHALPRYVEHFEERGELYLVTRKIEGESLAEAKSGGRTMSEASVARLLRDASSALDYLHGRAPPLIHRDIKPSNVICRPDGSYAFIDFGAVRDKMKPEGGSTVVGTFGYMAPEQFQGRAMPASDVYAVGATAITLLTGREPEDLPHRGLAIDVKAALAGGRTSDAMRRVLEAMLEPDPDRRAPRIAPLLAQLGEAAEAPKSRAEPSPPRRSAPRAPEAREGEFEEHDRWDNAASRLPGPLLFLMALAIGIAQIAVGLALRVLIPVLFTLLSVVFGKSLRTAGKTVNNAGKVAIRAMDRAKGVVRTRAHEEVELSRRGGRKYQSGAAVRVRGPAPKGKARVAGRDHDAEAEAELEAEQAAEEARRRERRRKRDD